MEDPRSIANVDQKKEAITVQNLLDMTSGLEWTEQVGGITPPIETDRQMADSVDWVKFILDRPISSAPGDTFNYDSGNPHLLSAILTKLTGMSTLDYAKAKLFGPLGRASEPTASHAGWFGLPGTTSPEIAGWVIASLPNLPRRLVVVDAHPVYRPILRAFRSGPSARLRR